MSPATSRNSTILCLGVRNYWVEDVGLLKFEGEELEIWPF